MVSACLLGEPVRYDGQARTSTNAHLMRWQHEGRIIAFCPEIAGGFSTPRLPAEIEPRAVASDVISGRARVIDKEGRDVTRGFLAGAKAAVAVAQNAGCAHAILTDGSPSCGTGFVYSGRFDGGRTTGIGLTTALLLQNGIQVWSEKQISDLADALSLK